MIVHVHVLYMYLYMMRPLPPSLRPSPQATDARRALPCWDEPAHKASFDVTLVVPSDRVALSNMVRGGSTAACMTGAGASLETSNNKRNSDINPS